MTAPLPPFAACFEALNGYAPYRWQQRLFDNLMAGRLPEALDLPTGLGKTAVIAVWLIAQAHGAKLPRRLVYVVDRRAVVDQATEVAERLRAKLGARAEPPPAGVLADLRNALELQDDLPISTLRGQRADNRRWMADPAGPAIIVGTVDMVGSRLLFSGYGVSKGMRPAHAGLLGVDSLFVLDEAHLVPPFEHLVRDVAATRPANCPLPPMRVISLSATGRDYEKPIFQLTDADRADPPAAARLQATKRLWLLEDESAKTLATRLSEQAWAFGEGGRRVIVFCNSRAVAQEVAATLEKKKKGDKSLKDAQLTTLLVGERRYRERDFATRFEPLAEGEADDSLRQQNAVFQRFLPGGASGEGHPPAFLVATSAGEVGIDLDADDLVCDLVAWERMVQRFGRVNRRAQPGEARIAIIPAIAEAKDDEDTIAADALAVLKAPFESAAWPIGAEAGLPAPERTVLGPKDASPGALATLKSDAGLKAKLQAATTPEPLRPPLEMADVEAWAMTSLDEHTGRPKVEPWLRGWIEKLPETTVLWRAQFPLRMGESPLAMKDVLTKYFEAVPPHFTESLAAPTWRVVEMVSKRAKALTRDDGDDSEADDGAEDNAAPEAVADDAGEARRHPPLAVVLERGKVSDVLSLQQLAASKNLDRDLAGKTLVLDARIGGLDAQGLLSPKAAEPPVTSDDEARRWSDELLRVAGRRVLFGERPERRATEPNGDVWTLADFRWTVSDAEDADGLWIQEYRGSKGNAVGDRFISPRLQSLADHHAWARNAAAAIMDRLVGLPAAYQAMVAHVAEVHDCGKDRKAWQDGVGAPREGRPYAKVGGSGRPPPLYRHEFGTLREIVDDLPANKKNLLPAEIVGDPGLLDLALHLIAAHHGHARPVIAPIDPEGSAPGSPEMMALAQEAALRFVRLQAKWGPWGLAWWETLLRAADWAASNRNDAAASADAGGHAQPAAQTSEVTHG